MIQRHELRGCTPSPQANYFKALAVLRLINSQADPAARGAWQQGVFVLWSTLTKDELERFFLFDYKPSSIVAPWNRGSGLVYHKGEPVVRRIIESPAPRFAALGGTLRRALALNISLGFRDGTQTDEDSQGASALKATLLKECRRTWRGDAAAWLDAAFVLGPSGEPEYPAIVGTGGNCGNLELTNNFYQRLSELFDVTGNGPPRDRECLESLRESLFGEVARGQFTAGVGQMLPVGIGGPNQTSGFKAEGSVNRWDFVLGLEGSLLFRSSLVRRSNPAVIGGAAAPFAVQGLAAGYASAATEKQKGEQWLPIWSRPVLTSELESLFAEARAQTGRTAARSALDLARAASRLGVARGIDGFVRYGYLERNGQSNLAVSLGYLPVRCHPKLHLVNELAPWMEQLHRRATDKNASLRLATLDRRLHHAVFDLLAHPDEPGRWQQVLLEAAAVESLLVPGALVHAGPIPQLSPEWLEAADDGSPELRLAVALGNAQWRTERGANAFPALRAHLLPWARGRLLSDSSSGKVTGSPDWVVSADQEPAAALTALVTRRLQLAEAGAERVLPLGAGPAGGAQLADLAALMDGQVDLHRVLLLARVVAAMGLARPPNLRPARGEAPDDGWLVVRLALIRDPTGQGLRVPADPAIVRRLASGDVAAAVQQAAQRLGGAGLPTVLYSATADARAARRWAAALAFPLSPEALRAAVRRVLPQHTTPQRTH